MGTVESDRSPFLTALPCLNSHVVKTERVLWLQVLDFFSTKTCRISPDCVNFYNPNHFIYTIKFAHFKVLRHINKFTIEEKRQQKSGPCRLWICAVLAPGAGTVDQRRCKEPRGPGNCCRKNWKESINKASAASDTPHHYHTPASGEAGGCLNVWWWQ